jgi:CheY-like chemotaxis protein
MAEVYASVEAAVFSPASILIVEDEVLIRLDLADELRAAGYRVIEAINADEALAVLRGVAKVDLVLTDVRMPGSIDGHALALTIRSELPNIKIVIASAHASDIDSSTANAVFLKPYNFSTLVTAIKNLLA